MQLLMRPVCARHGGSFGTITAVPMIHRNWKLLKRFRSPQNADLGEKLFTKYRKLVRLNTNQWVCQWQCSRQDWTSLTTAGRLRPPPLCGFSITRRIPEELELKKWRKTCQELHPSSLSTALIRFRCTARSAKGSVPQFCVAICSPDNKYRPVGIWRKIWKYPVFRSSTPMHSCFPRVTSKVESDREPSFRHHCRVKSQTVEDHDQPREDPAVFPGVPRYCRDSKLFRGDMAGDPSESTSRRSISFLSERGRSCWLNTVEDHVCTPFITTTRWGLIASETQSALTSAPRGLSNATRRKS
jgi:hypothetical protein